jgi:pilus assembly protein CpaB
MTRRRIIIVLAAVLLTLFGMVVIVAYVSSAERRALEGTELVPVFVATQDIDANTPASDIGELVAPEDIPERLRQDDAISNLENLEGQVTTSPIRAGEQIVQRQFGEASEVGPSGVADIDESHSILTISLPSDRAVGGRLAPDDLVSVIVSISNATVQAEGDTTQTVTPDNTTGTVLHNVRVVDVRGGVSEETGEAAGTVVLSLEVDEEEAETIVFAMEFGSVWLVLNGENVSRPDVGTRDRDDLYPGTGGGAQ